MSLADELLNSIDDGEVSLFNPNFVIGDDRAITVHETMRKLGVQYDHNVKTVTFDCPRYCDTGDLSTMNVYINYKLSDEVVGSHLCTNVAVDQADANLMHFDWTISGHVTYAGGPVEFSVCIRKVDDEGNEVMHWNSEVNTDTFVSPGLKCENVIVEQYPDIISYVIGRMDQIEAMLQGGS